MKLCCNNNEEFTCHSTKQKKTINSLGANYQKADRVSKCFDSVSPTSVDNTTAP